MLNIYNLFLSHTEIFKGIPVQDIDKAIACLRGFYKSFDDGQEVYNFDDTVSYMGILISGEVNIEHVGIDGKVVLLKQVGKGELFGAALCYLREPNRFLRMVSVGKTKVLFIRMPGGQQYERCACPYRVIVLENILKEMALDAQQLNMKIQLLIQTSLRSKILFYLNVTSRTLNKNPFVIPFTREKLAQFICADRSAVSRELGRMNKEKIIKLEGKKITLL